MSRDFSRERLEALADFFRQGLRVAGDTLTLRISQRGMKAIGSNEDRHAMLLGITREGLLRIRKFQNKNAESWYPAYWEIDPHQTAEGEGVR